jgi:hypothetical protein
VLVLLLLCPPDVTPTMMPATTAAAPIPINAASDNTGAATGPAAGPGSIGGAGGGASGAGAGAGAADSELAPPDDAAPPDVPAPPLWSCAKALPVAAKIIAPPAKIDIHFRCIVNLPQNHCNGMLAA